MEIVVPTKNQNPKITFGFVNCNRLHYLKSCVESLIDCTSDYDNKEIIIVDNASIEEGTKEYLLEKEKMGYRVFRSEVRDPSNEYAKALNLIARESTGDLVCPVTGDVQFVVRGTWLSQYANFFKSHWDNIGCISLDAQRAVRLVQHEPFRVFSQEEFGKEFRFFIDLKRRPVAGNGLAFYRRDLLEKIYPWHESNSSHDGGDDSENKMWKKVERLIESRDLGDIFHIVPQVPVAVSICTDRRGSSAIVRGNSRYGEYWPPKEEFRYYKIHEYDDIIKRRDENESRPLSIEMITEALGWNLPIDEMGKWKKTALSPEICTGDQVFHLEGGNEDSVQELVTEESHISDWLED